jgi:hypothetical protein
MVLARWIERSARDANNGGAVAENKHHAISASREIHYRSSFSSAGSGWAPSEVAFT